MIRVILFGIFFLFVNFGSAQTNLDTAVNFTVKDVTGYSHDLFSYLDNGKFVVLDFFFTTCGPCISAIPDMNQTMETYGCNESDLFMLSIDYGDSDADVLQYINQYGTMIPAVSGLEGGGDYVAETYGIYFYPTVILIAPNRQIINQDIFPVTFDNLSTAIEGQAGLEPISEPCNLATSITNIRDVSIDLTLSPNPASGYLDVSISTLKALDLELWIVDSFGNRQYSVSTEMVKASHSELRMDIHSLRPGSYYIVLLSEGAILSNKRFQVF